METPDRRDRTHSRTRGKLNSRRSRGMWWRRRRSDDDFREEVNAHLDLDTDRLIAEGMSPELAKAAARRAFGNVARVQERFYESRRILWLDHARQDFIYALRSFVHNPGFALVVVVTLALGIGANTAIFSLVNSLLLRPLPVRNPEQLVVVVDPSRGLDLPASVPNLLSFMWNYPMWVQIRQRPQLFDGAFGYFYSRFNLSSGGETEFVDGLYASGRFFETYRCRSHQGQNVDRFRRSTRRRRLRPCRGDQPQFLAATIWWRIGCHGTHAPCGSCAVHDCWRVDAGFHRSGGRSRT